MIAAVEVGVSLSRPPQSDAKVWVLVAAETETEARLVACQIAAADTTRKTMPVSADIVDLLEL